MTAHLFQKAFRVGGESLANEDPAPQSTPFYFLIPSRVSSSHKHSSNQPRIHTNTVIVPCLQPTSSRSAVTGRPPRPPFCSSSRADGVVDRIKCIVPIQKESCCPGHLGCMQLV
ncbi:unnamed protein product [Protopolystoma xenopodis]|uniref:Uncharacterized protein n=1 Tax=Protopolystoma xenopodis TaxID=117903 RepID=A0A448XLB7_9PLAT|nr:unnamed protein product [Protopolystoma xenopodis]